MTRVHPYRYEGMKKRIMLAVASLAVGGVTALATPPAHAGVLDSTLNNAHVLSDVGVLNTLVNSVIGGVEGNSNNSSGQHG